MKSFTLLFAAVVGVGLPKVTLADDTLPFQHKVEVYRDKQNDVTVFTLRLEQPFLADEFEKSSYLRLKANDERAYLIYPKETRFQQKHAEFFGRLRGEGKANLTLSYEIVSENLDGSRRVEVRQGKIAVVTPPMPKGATTLGPKNIYRQWAQQQNVYFAKLLRYYPEGTFYQYCLLQSQARYGVAPPSIPKVMPDRTSVETDLYQVFTGSLAIQDSLQRETLSARSRVGDLNKHISALRPPALRSLPYKDLLKKKQEEENIKPLLHEIARIVPEDQYFLHFNTIDAMSEAGELSSQWGNSLLRLFTVQAREHGLRAKLEDQLCLRQDGLAELAAGGAIGELAITGADPFVMEGTDVTLIIEVKQQEAFRKAAGLWLDEAAKKFPQLVARDFNYRGHKVTVHYTGDRVVSSFVVWHDDYAIYSNSHRSVRRIIDAVTGMSPNLYDALDYRYVTTILPPKEADNSGYLFASEAFIKRLVGPAAKISEKRRLQCFSNLVMLNNASLFYRLEYGRSPKSLSELVEGRFVDPQKIVCPHGGAYAFDAEGDTCTCSLHNRLKYLTPNAELSVLNVSSEEAAEYDRYKTRYAAFWQEAFDPLAVRITVAQRMKLEMCVLPFANGSFYQTLRGIMAKNPQPLGTARIAPSAIASLVAVPGRKNIAESLSSVPGVSEVLKNDPMLTDLKWIGDRMSVHFCDGSSILEIDPAQMQQLELPLIGRTSLMQQGVAGVLLLAVKMPVYATIDVDNREKAARLLEQLSEQIFLQKSKSMGVTTSMDAYRLPDYKKHAIYVFSGQVYALKLRLHVSLVGDQLVAASKPEILREVIDAAGNPQSQTPAQAHMLLRINRQALGKMYDDVQLYWAEKSRLACHRNIISIYNLYKLYDIPVEQVSRLSEAKYGVTSFCPDHGDYSFDAERNQIVCSVHGNRQRSRQKPRLDSKSSFTRFIESQNEIIASLRFEDDALITTLEIQRGK